MDTLTTLGSFKGVMLCNRPAQIPGSFQSITAPRSDQSAPTKPAFVATVRQNDIIGLPPAKQTEPPHAKPQPTAQHTITLRHKKWLNDYAARKRYMKRALLERAKQLQEEKRRFMEQSAAMRQSIRQSDKNDVNAIIEALQHVNSTNANDITSSLQQQPQQSSYDSNVTNNLTASRLNDKLTTASSYTTSQEHKENTESSTAPTISVSASNTRPAVRSSASSTVAQSKPGWARSESEAESLFDAEAAELVDFAHSLDYDSYVHDIEVKEALKFVKDRMEHLEMEKLSEVQKQQLEAERLASGDYEAVLIETGQVDESGAPIMKQVLRRVIHKKKGALQSSQQPQAQFNGNPYETTFDSTTRQLSQAALDSNRAVRAIHSSASIRSVVEKERERVNQHIARLPSITDEEQNEETAIPNPLIVSHGAGSKLGVKDGIDPNNLPYLYRHPAI